MLYFIFRKIIWKIIVEKGRYEAATATKILVATNRYEPLLAVRSGFFKNV